VWIPEKLSAGRPSTVQRWKFRFDPGRRCGAFYGGKTAVSVAGTATQFAPRNGRRRNFAQHVHWGATSQDIIDTPALMLRLRSGALQLAEDGLA